MLSCVQVWRLLQEVRLRPVQALIMREAHLSKVRSGGAEKWALMDSAWGMDGGRLREPTYANTHCTDPESNHHGLLSLTVELHNFPSFAQFHVSIVGRDDGIADTELCLRGWWVGVEQDAVCTLADDRLKLRVRANRIGEEARFRGYIMTEISVTRDGSTCSARARCRWESCLC